VVLTKVKNNRRYAVDVARREFAEPREKVAALQRYKHELKKNG
jgi:hypothetical protein